MDVLSISISRSRTRNESTRHIDALYILEENEEIYAEGEAETTPGLQLHAKGIAVL